MKIGDFKQPRTMTLTIIADQQNLNDWYWIYDSHLSGEVIHGMMIDALAEGDLIRYPSNTDSQTTLGDILSWYCRDGLFCMSWDRIKQVIRDTVDGDDAAKERAWKTIYDAWHSIPKGEK